MGAFANLSANDGEASPVAHVFVPQGYDSQGIARWVNRNASVPAASELFSVLRKDSPADPGDYSIPGKRVAPRRVEQKLKYPITYTDSVTGLVLVDYVNEKHVTYLIHPRATELQVKNLRFVGVNLESVGIIADCLQKNEGFY